MSKRVNAARSAVGGSVRQPVHFDGKTDQNTSRATKLKMETQYYNLIPPLAKSEDLGPVSPGSDDSGVQDEVQPLSSRPQRPPRSIDCTTPSKLPMHSYINLGLGAVPSTPPKLDFSGVSIPNTPPPTLPKRMPYLVQSPMLNHKSSHLPLQRSASSHSTRGRNRQQSQGIASKGICKCKVATRQVNSELTTEAGKKNCCFSPLSRKGNDNGAKRSWRPSNCFENSRWATEKLRFNENVYVCSEWTFIWLEASWCLKTLLKCLIFHTSHGVWKS